MSANFFNYIQPTIIKASNDSDVPEHLRNNYMLNLNAICIQHFVSNFLLMENPETGGLMYMLTNDFDKIRINDLKVEDVLDIPRAYIVLTPSFMNDQTNFKNWVLECIGDPAKFGIGIENFRPGVDYYINDVLYDYLKEYEVNAVENMVETVKLHNYLDSGFAVTKYWQVLDNATISYSNYSYFFLKNELLKLRYTEDELANFYITFFNLIRQYAIVSEHDMLETINQIYDRVIEYYRNYQSDEATSALNLILGTKISKVLPDSLQNCGCKTNTNNNATSSYNTNSCIDIYRNSMYEYLLNMLADAEFYKDWMYIENIEGQKVANDSLIEALLELLKEFEEIGYDLGFAGKYLIHGNCCKDNQYATENDKNHSIIQNYIKVLNWVLDGCIDENTNKIAVYGKKFAELLPKLQF